MKNSFSTKTKITCNKNEYTIFDISKIPGVDKLPYSIKILLENLVRNEDDITVTKEDINDILKDAFTPDRSTVRTIKTGDGNYTWNWGAV